MRMLEALSKIGIIGLFKTVCFNFRYLPFKQAVFMPVILTSKVSVRSMGRGRIVLDDLGGQIWCSENRAARFRIMLQQTLYDKHTR